MQFVSPWEGLKHVFKVVLREVENVSKQVSPGWREVRGSRGSRSVLGAVWEEGSHLLPEAAFSMLDSETEAGG